MTDRQSPVPFARWLRARRVELDHDQDVAAKTMGVGLGKLRRWEAGEIPSKLADVDAIATWAGVDRDTLASMLLDELAERHAATA